MHLRRAVLLATAAAAAALPAACRIERNPPPAQTRVVTGADTMRVRGLQTVVYHVRDLDEARDWYAQLLGVAPYFDEPFYVGFHVGRYELALDPDTTAAAPGIGGAIAYWTVADVDAAFARALDMGATAHEEVQEVGGGIRVASVLDPFGNVLGFIDNPAFREPAQPERQ